MTSKQLINNACLNKEVRIYRGCVIGDTDRYDPFGPIIDIHFGAVDETVRAMKIVQDTRIKRIDKLIDDIYCESIHHNPFIFQLIRDWQHDNPPHKQIKRIYRLFKFEQPLDDLDAEFIRDLLLLRRNRIADNMCAHIDNIRDNIESNIMKAGGKFIPTYRRNHWSNILRTINIGAVPALSIVNKLYPRHGFVFTVYLDPRTIAIFINIARHILPREIIAFIIITARDIVSRLGTSW